MQTMQKTEEQQRYGISRLVAFSDGVFGFAITLLIVNVISAFPPLPLSATDPRLVGALLGLGSTFFSYALSFYVGGRIGLPITACSALSSAIIPRCCGSI
jgi:uncharacterized membrane protein